MFQVNKTLAIKKDPFNKGVYTTILTKTEELLTKEKHIEIRLFDVNYIEIHSTKPGYRMFKIKEAFNQRDK